MVMLFTASGNPLTDSAGNHLRTGQTPRTPPFTFSDGIVRGTVPLDKGEAASMCRLVASDWLWLGPDARSKPKSRDPDHLMAVRMAGQATVRTHTGAEYESGAANAARGQNDAPRR